MNTAIITGIASIIAALIAAYFAMRGKKGENRVSEIAQLLDGYKDIVHTLQSEVKRLEERIESMKVEMEDCERRNAATERQLAELRNTVEHLTKGDRRP